MASPRVLGLPPPTSQPSSLGRARGAQSLTLEGRRGQGRRGSPGVTFQESWVNPLRPPPQEPQGTSGEGPRHALF